MNMTLHPRPLEVTMVGELTLDEVVNEDGPCHWKQPGGGALFSAIGALFWGARPRLSAAIGRDYPDHLLERIEGAGIDLAGIARIDGGSLGVWLLHETGGRRHQIAKASGSSFAIIDAARPSLTPAGDRHMAVHLAPQSTMGQLRALADLVAIPGAIVTQDVMVEPFMDLAPYLDGRALRGTTAFLPSEQEIHQLWGASRDERSLATDLRRRDGIAHLVIKRGAVGVDVIGVERTIRVPAVPVDVLDTTGAGDAFCGGYLVGLAETGDPVEAAVRGAVSASFIIETVGADIALDRIDRVEADRRANRLRDLIRPQRSGAG